MKHPFYTLIAFLFLVACNTAPSTPDAANSLSSDTPSQISSDAPMAMPTDYVGLSIADATIVAENNNVRFRVIKLDGNDLPATMDFVPGRINAEVEKDIVVRYTVEGQDVPNEMYTDQSWQMMIDSSCTSFHDGCNTCNRIAGSSDAACTKMFCETYTEPRCLDKE